MVSLLIENYAKDLNKTPKEKCVKDSTVEKTNNETNTAIGSIRKKQTNDTQEESIVRNEEASAKSVKDKRNSKKEKYTLKKDLTRENNETKTKEGKTNLYRIFKSGPVASPSAGLKPAPVRCCTIEIVRAFVMFDRRYVYVE